MQNDRALTPHEKRLVERYGFCEHCGGPLFDRRVVVTSSDPGEPWSVEIWASDACLWNDCNEAWMPAKYRTGDAGAHGVTR